MATTHDLQVEAFRRFTGEVIAAVSEATRDLLRELSAGRFVEIPDVSLWTVEQELQCSKCGDVGEARFALPTFFEFDSQLRSGAFRCECGGKLKYEWQRIVLLD